MAHHVELQCSALSDTGLVRAQNEDAIAVLAELGVAILADGMGGYQAGEVASRMAIEVCTRSLQQDFAGFDWSPGSDRSERLSSLMLKAVFSANAAIYQASQAEACHAGMGTTLILTLAHHDKLLVAHVGDSRVYRLRDGQLEQITRDHSQVQDQVDAGLLTPEQARNAPNRNLVTRALGIDMVVEPELNRYATRAGDLYLLCSDGLNDMVDDAQIAAIVRTGSASLDATAAALVASANAMGGADNVSVILLRIDDPAAEAVGLLERMLEWVR